LRGFFYFYPMNNWITIKTFWLSHEPTMVKSYLESEGIDCFLKDELTINSDPLISNAIGGVKLQVQEEDYARAYELLQLKGYINESDKFENTLQYKVERFLRRVFKL